MRLRPSALLGLAAALAGAGASPAAAAAPRAGAWEGADARDEAVAFDVRRGQIVDMSLPYRCDGQRRRIELGRGTAIDVGRRGSFAQRDGNRRLTVVRRGRFVSRTRVAGTYQVVDRARGCRSGRVRWSARAVRKPIIPARGGWRGRDDAGGRVRLTLSSRAARRLPARRTQRWLTAFRTDAGVACGDGVIGVPDLSRVSVRVDRRTGRFSLRRRFDRGDALLLEGRFGRRGASGTWRYIADPDVGSCDSGQVDWRARR